MIQANELRIGNIVYENGFDQQCIVIVTPAIIAEAESDPNRFSPVPLCEDWLVRFGFFCINRISQTYKKYIGDENSDTIYCELYQVGPIPEYYISVAIEGICIKMRKRIKYVHELQNVNFTYTGEELTLKEKGE